VLWQEVVKPLLLIEFVSGDGSEERDRTPYKGKFWVYEQAICATFYAIFDAARNTLEVYCLDTGRYRPVAANAAGRFPIAPLGIELGIWEGEYREMHLPWLRVWDSATGQMMPLSEERAEAEKQRAEAAEELLDDTRLRLDDETERAESERKRADTAEELAAKLAAKLRALGIDPDA
jgi:hypothetical protein